MRTQNVKWESRVSTRSVGKIQCRVYFHLFLKILFNFVISDTTPKDELVPVKKRCLDKYPDPDEQTDFEETNAVVGELPVLAVLGEFVNLAYY